LEKLRESKTRAPTLTHGNFKTDPPVKTFTGGSWHECYARMAAAVTSPG